MAIAKGMETWRGQIRLPKPMFDWMKKRAEESFRSLNAEIVEIIRERMNQENKQQLER